MTLLHSHTSRPSEHGRVGSVGTGFESAAVAGFYEKQLSLSSGDARCKFILQTVR